MAAGKESSRDVHRHHLVPVGESQVDASIAGQLSEGLAVVVEPIGFNREIALALIPAMAAREVAVSSLATTYAVDADDDEQAAEGLIPKLQAGWTLPTALAFLAWFVFAPQCISTIAVTPCSKVITVLSAKDLKPWSSSLVSRTSTLSPFGTPARWVLRPRASRPRARWLLLLS